MILVEFLFFVFERIVSSQVCNVRNFNIQAKMKFVYYTIQPPCALGVGGDDVAAFGLSFCMPYIFCKSFCLESCISIRQFIKYWLQSND